MCSSKLKLWVVGVQLVAATVSPCWALELGSVQTGRTTNASAQLNPSALGLTSSTQLDEQLAVMWKLTIPEIQRARLLMQGPRGAFSSAQLSPIEALGIHARSDAERIRYARLFAQASLADTQLVLAWTRVASEEAQRITAGMPVLNFDGLPKPVVSEEAADMLGVPRTAVTPPVKNSAPKTQAPSTGPVGRSYGPAADNRERR